MAGTGLGRDEGGPATNKSETNRSQSKRRGGLSPSAPSSFGKNRWRKPPPVLVPVVVVMVMPAPAAMMPVMMAATAEVDGQRAGRGGRSAQQGQGENRNNQRLHELIPFRKRGLCYQPQPRQKRSW